MRWDAARGFGETYVGQIAYGNLLQNKDGRFLIMHLLLLKIRVPPPRDGGVFT